MPPLKVVPDFPAVMDWVLNAHLGQYSQAFLGFAGPTIEDALTPPA